MISSFVWNNIEGLIFSGKASDAAQSAYYDPNRPQCAYVPPPSYYVSILNFYSLEKGIKTVY